MTVGQIQLFFYLRAPCSVTSIKGLYSIGPWVELHEDVEQVEWQPRDEEDEGDAQDHDVGPASLLVVLGVLALKRKRKMSPKI